MSKRKISAKEAVVDIRAGMDDSSLMKKYNLSPEGLQSLFDKLVNAGIIDLAEMEGRLRGFWGTVIIPESELAWAGSDVADTRKSPARQPPPRIHAQEAARDIRLGMNDTALTKKYGLSAKGLQSLFDKLVLAGLITQEEIARRDLGIDQTVDLREEMLSLSGALRRYGVGLAASPAEQTDAPPQAKVTQAVKKNTEQEQIPLHNKNDDSVQVAKRDAKPYEKSWYLRPLTVSLALVILLALGVCALYRSSFFQP